MLGIRELTDDELNYLYQYCPNPSKVDEGLLKFSVAKFIYSYLHHISSGKMDRRLTLRVIQDLINTPVKIHRYQPRYQRPDRATHEEDTIVHRVSSWSLDWLIGNASKTSQGLTYENAQRIIVELNRHIETLLEYVEANLAYPMSAIINIYHAVAGEYHEELAAIQHLLSEHYASSYNRMVDSDDEIKAASIFLVEYMEFMRDRLPMIHDAHLLVAYMVINYYLYTTNYHLFIPMFNIDRISQMIDRIPPDEWQRRHRYRLTIGNYLLSGLDCTLSEYQETL